MIVLQVLQAAATGIAQVFLVQLQVRQVTTKVRTGMIFLVGVGISAAWVLNVHSAIAGFYTGAAYALGAGVGSVLATKVHLKKAKKS